jgi:hypothetical protein
MATVGMAVGAFGQYNFRYNTELGRSEKEADENGQMSLDQVPFLSGFVAGSPGNARLVWFLLPELAVFLLEDATTIYIWCMTDTFNTDNLVGVINVITTITSAVGIVILLIYCTVVFFRTYGDSVECFSCADYSLWKDEDARTFVILVLGSLIIVGFFGYTAIGEVAFGDNAVIADGMLKAVQVFYGIGCTLGVYVMLMIRGALMIDWMGMPCSTKYGMDCHWCLEDDACCCDPHCSCNLDGCCAGQCWCGEDGSFREHICTPLLNPHCCGYNCCSACACVTCCRNSSDKCCGLCCGYD